MRQSGISIKTEELQKSKKKKEKKKEVNMLYIKWRMIKLDVTTNKYVCILSFWVSVKKN